MIGRTHPSVVRLLEAARDGLQKPQLSMAELVADLNVSPQLVTNWKSRGVSRDGAIAAGAKYGVAAEWIRTGAGEMRPRPVATQTPPPKPDPTFSDRHEVGDSDWALLQAVKVATTDDEKREILRRHEELQRQFARQYDAIKAGGQS